MPTTSGGIVYPSSTDDVDVPGDMQAMANSVQTLLNAISAASPDNKPRLHAHSATSQTIPSSSGWTLINFDGETYDNDTMHDPVGTPYRVTLTTAGLYAFDYQIALNPQANAFTISRLNIRLNSSGSSAGGTTLKVLDYGVQGAVMQFRFNRVFAAGDYVECFASQTSGVSWTTDNTGLATRVFVTYVASS